MFVKDSRVENLLTRFGVSWKWTNNLNFKMLAPNWKLHNKGRSKAIDEDVVLEYAALIQVGSSPPGGIYWKVKHGLEILDGVQRLSAEEYLDATTFSGYVIVTDSEIIALQIRLFANHLLSGHPEQTEFTRRRAIQHLIIEGGMSVNDVARLGGWTKKAVEDDYHSMTALFGLHCIGFEGNLPKGVLIAIAKHSEKEDYKKASQPIAQFCDELRRAKFNNGESETYIKEFFSNIKRNGKETLHDQYNERLQSFHDDPEVQSRLEGRQSSRQKDDIKLRASMKRVLTITDELIKEKVQIAYLEEYFQMWNKIEDNLKKLSKKRLTKV